MGEIEKATALIAEAMERATEEQKERIVCYAEGLAAGIRINAEK